MFFFLSFGFIVCIDAEYSIYIKNITLMSDLFIQLVIYYST